MITLTLVTHASPSIWYTYFLNSFALCELEYGTLCVKAIPSNVSLILAGNKEESHESKAVVFGQAWEVRICGAEEKRVSIWMMRFLTPNKNTFNSAHSEDTTPMGRVLLTSPAED